MGYKPFGNEENDFMAVITSHNYTMIELYYQLHADLESGSEERALHIVFEIADTKYVKYAYKLLKRYDISSRVQPLTERISCFL